MLQEGLVLPRLVSQNYIRPVLVRMHTAPGELDRIGTSVRDLLVGHRAALNVFVPEDRTAPGGPNDIRRLPPKLGTSAARTRPPYRLSQKPSGRSRSEVSGLAREVRHTPVAQILIERCGIAEHVYHVHDSANVPRTDVVIERCSLGEHAAHVHDLADVPRTDGLIERGGLVEHVAHVRDLSDVPRTDVLIERGGRVKHVGHVHDLADVPRTDVLIERCGLPEHGVHGCDLADVP